MIELSADQMIGCFFDQKSFQCIPLILVMVKRPMAFQLYTNDLCDDGMCNMVSYTDDIILYSKCDGAFGLWEQLELASEIDSGLMETLDWWKLTAIQEKHSLFYLTS